MKPKFNFLKIFDRYSLIELLAPFIFFIFGLLIVGLADILFSLLDVIIARNISLAVIIKLLLLKSPSIIVFFLPIATLFTVLLTLIKWIKDNELLIYGVSGIKHERIFLPIIFFSFLVTILSFFISETVIPATNYASNNIIHKIILSDSLPSIEENIFFKEIGNRFFYIKKIDSITKKLSDIMIYETNASFPTVITAKSASWEKSSWNLENGRIYRYSSDGFLEYESQFNNMIIQVDYNFATSYQKIRNTKEMGMHELKQRINEVTNAGLDTKVLRVEYYNKFATPFSGMVFALVGIVLIRLFIKSSRDVTGIIFTAGFSLLSIGAFFSLIAVSRTFGMQGILSPLLSAWLPCMTYTIFFSLLWLFQRNRI